MYLKLTRPFPDRPLFDLMIVNLNPDPTNSTPFTSPYSFLYNKTCENLRKKVTRT